MREQQPSILVVDDQLKLARLVAELLKRLGFPDIDIATDGTEALEKLRAKPYGLVISDWEMEPMDGFQLLKEMRADDALVSVPFIITESTVTFEQVTLAHHMGADAFLLKPFDLPLLKQKLKTVLGRRPRKREKPRDWSPMDMEFALLGRAGGRA